MRNTPTRLLTKLVAIPAVLILSATAGLAADAPAASDDAAGLVKSAVDALNSITVRNLPSTISVRAAGQISSVSIVPRSFSPAARSIAG